MEREDEAGQGPKCNGDSEGLEFPRIGDILNNVKGPAPAKSRITNSSTLRHGAGATIAPAASQKMSCISKSNEILLILIGGQNLRGPHVLHGEYEGGGGRSGERGVCQDFRDCPRDGRNALQERAGLRVRDQRRIPGLGGGPSRGGQRPSAQRTNGFSPRATRCPRSRISRSKLPRPDPDMGQHWKVPEWETRTPMAAWRERSKICAASCAH